MSNLGRQFTWRKEYDADTGETHYVHGPSGVKILNTLHTRHKWEIRGGSHHAEVFKTLSEAKKRIESTEA